MEEKVFDLCSSYTDTLHCIIFLTNNVFMFLCFFSPPRPVSLLKFFSYLFYTLFCSGTEKKKEKLQGQRERKEDSHSNDQNPQTQASPSPQPSAQTLPIHKQTPEVKSPASGKRFPMHPRTELGSGCSSTNTQLGFPN